MRRQPSPVRTAGSYSTKSIHVKCFWLIFSQKAMLGVGCLSDVAAADRALAADAHAVFHVAYHFAAQRTGFADVRANRANLFSESRAAQQEIGAGLTDLSAIDHEPEMLRFNELLAFFQAMVEGSLQASLMATCGEIYTRLEVGVRWGTVLHGQNIGVGRRGFRVVAYILTGSLRDVDEFVGLETQRFSLGYQLRFYRLGELWSARQNPEIRAIRPGQHHVVIAGFIERNDVVGTVERPETTP